MVRAVTEDLPIRKLSHVDGLCLNARALIGGEVLAEHEKPWFKRGRAGVGYRPQTWQGWAVLGAFLLLLGGSVELVQMILGEDARGQSIAFLVAAFEIMGFMRFIRTRAETAPPLK